MIRYLSLKGVATYTGLAYNTVKDYRRKGLLPLHDAILAGPEPEDGEPEPDTVHEGWLADTIDSWSRPGQGARTDLRKGSS